MMSNHFSKRVAAVLFGLAPCLLLAQPVPNSTTHTEQPITAANTQAMSSWRKTLEKDNMLIPGDEISTTAYETLFAIRNTQHPFTFRYYGQYTDERSTWVFNTYPGKKGYSVVNVSSFDTFLKDRRDTLGKWAAQIPTSQFIPLKNATGFVAVIYSAPDCPYCLQLEAELSKQKISFVVAPTGLSQSTVDLVKRLYCSENAPELWRTVMSRRGIAPKPKEGCRFPQRDVDDFAHAFFHFGNKTTPSTPLVVFRDGHVEGGDVVKVMEKAKQMLNRKQFFEVPTSP